MKVEYILSKQFKVVADSVEDADQAFKYALEEGIYSDDIHISMEVINKIVSLDTGGEKHYVWNKDQNKWEITRYSLD